MNVYSHCRLFLRVLVLSVVLSQPSLAAPVELSLDESVAMALKNNYDIHYAKSAREKTFWALEEAGKNKGVSLKYTHTDERYNTPPSLYSDTYTYTTTFDNQFSLSVPIYSGGKLESQIEQARLNLKVADLEIQATKQQLRQTVISGYLTVLQYRNEVQINLNTVKNYEDHLNLVKEKFDLGMVAKTDVLSSQVNLAKAQDSLIKAQNNHNNAVAALNNAIGLPHGAELKLKDGFSYEKYPLTLEECIQHAESYRPEIAQNQAKVASARHGVKIAKSGHAPTVDFSAEQDWNDTQLAGTKNSNWLIKLTTSLNVFDAGLTDAKIKQAQHNVNMVSDEAAQQRDSILLDVRQDYLSMQEAEKRIKTNELSVGQAEENLMIEKVKYEVGSGTNLDLLDAVLSLDSAKKDYNQALYDYNTNKAKLEEAMGLPVK